MVQIGIDDEAKQDKRLIDPEWWRESGELPGIFIWALKGLERLRQRGYFNEPKECREAKEKYELDSNPARLFLQDTCTAHPKGHIRSDILYTCYHESIKDGGQHPLGKPQFAGVVKKVASSTETVGEFGPRQPSEQFPIGQLSH